MKMATKRLLYLTFFALFFITTPLVIFYSSGYRYNFKKNIIEKTGILIVESSPKNSAVFLNNERIKKNTPAKITNLFSGYYELRVEKNGYHPWIKEVKIRNGLTTFVKNIQLFTKSLPILKVNENIIWSENISGKNKYLYAAKINGNIQLKIYSAGQDKNQAIIYETKNEIIIPKGWSANNNKILLLENTGASNKYFIINTDSNQIENISNFTKLDFENLKWDKRNNNVLYGIRKNVIYQIDLLNNIAKAAHSDVFIDYLGINFALYYTKNANNNSLLVRKNLTNGEESTIKLPALSMYTFNNYGEEIFLLKDQTKEKMYVLNINIFDLPDSQKYIDYEINVREAIWAPDNKQILFYNNSEIWSYNIIYKYADLIARFGGKINNCWWHPTKNYIIYQLNNTIKITELNQIEPKITYDIASLDSLANFFVNDSGNALIIFGKIGSQEGLFELKIK